MCSLSGFDAYEPVCNDSLMALWCCSFGCKDGDFTGVTTCLALLVSGERTGTRRDRLLPLFTAEAPVVSFLVLYLLIETFSVLSVKFLEGDISLGLIEE